MATPEERIAELEAALKPFADYARQQEQAWRRINDKSAFYGVKHARYKVQIRYSDFRRARAVMEKADGKASGVPE